MGIRSSVARWLIKAADVGGWNIAKWQEKRQYHPDYSHQALVERYQSWIYTCANKNAISCAQVPLRLYTQRKSSGSRSKWPTRRIDNQQQKYLSASPSIYRKAAGDVEEVTEHPFITLMTNVNEFMNSFDLLESLFVSQELTGNAYWKLVFDVALGVPTEIWPLFPQYMKIIPDRINFIQSYVYMAVPNDKHVIEPNEIVHFKYYNPKNALYGTGPLQACVIAADLSFNMNLYETSLMKNRAMPDMALVLPPEAGEPSEEQKEQMYSGWKQRFRGVKQAGDMVILTGGADLKKISFTPKEMAFLKGRNASREEIAGVFGVPISKLTSDQVNRANAEAGDYSYMKDTILPRLRKVEQKLNERVMPLYDENLFVAFDNPVPKDKEFRLEQSKSRLSNGQTTINEERAQDGLEPVGWGDMPIMPMNMTPLGTAQPLAPTQSVQENSVSWSYNTPETTDVALKAPRKLPPLQHPTNFINEPLVRAVQSVFKEQRAEILAAFDRDIDEILKTSKLGDRYATKNPVDDYMTGWFDMQKWETQLAAKTEPFVRYTFMAGGERSMKQLAVERQFDPINPKAATSFEKHRFGVIKQTNDTSRKRVRRVVANGVTEGKGATVIRSELQKEFDWMERSQAAVIARTETIWAWNDGAVQGYMQSGIVEKKQWLASDDERSCDFCPQMDGKIIGVEAPFFQKGGTPMAGMPDLAAQGLIMDYEDIGHPPIHPQCRCAIVPVIEGI